MFVSMKKFIVCFIFVQAVLKVSAVTLPNMTSAQAFAKIDTAVLNVQHYVKELDVRISRLKDLQRHASTIEERYDICRQLMDCYENYRSDSTFYYIDYCERIAVEAGREDWLLSLSLYRINIFLQLNMLPVAKDELDKIDEHKLNHSQLMEYYVWYHTFYVQMQKHIHALDATRQAEYEQKAQYYLNKVYTEATLDDASCKYLLMNLYLDQEKSSEMIAYVEREMENWKSMSEREVAEHAGVIYDLYYLTGNEGQMYAWLSFAVDHAFLHFMRDYGPRLVTRLIEEGDINRAYRYISFLLMQVARYPDYRNLDVLPNQLEEIFKMSKEADLKAIQDSHRRFWGAVAIAVAFAVFSLVTVLLVCKLAKQRRLLTKRHEQLRTSQESLKQQMEETRRAANLLEQANRQKEAYIGQIFLLCNKNITKVEDLRLTIYRLLKVGKSNEALTLTQKKDALWANELKEMEDTFDETFLAIYPNFVQDFNGLLREEEHYSVSGGTLNTELRIYALVWLGINNSQRIANLLHLSPKTVYNARLKVRGKALPSDEDFPARVWHLNRSDDETPLFY